MWMVTPYYFLQFLKVRITDNFAITRRSYCEGVKSVAIAKLFHQQISQLVLRRSINVAIASNDVEFKQQRLRRLRKRHLIKRLFAYSISFHSSNVTIFFFGGGGCWILKDCIQVQEKKKKVVVECSHPRRNVTPCSRATGTTAKKCRKKRDCARAWLLFFLYTVIAFLPSSLPSQ